MSYAQSSDHIFRFYMLSKKDLNNVRNQLNPAAMSAPLARREAEVEVLLNIGVEVEMLL